MLLWLRRKFITGFFVTVPLVISIAALVWIFQVLDGFTGPLYERWLERWLGRPVSVPGLGILTVALFVLAVGVIATNVLGKRLLQRTEGLLLKVPVFKTVYAPIKQLVAAFSPDNEFGFKRVVMVEAPGRGVVLGFETQEFSVDRGRGPEPMMAVYVPTNHLYLGDVMVFSRDQVFYPDITVQEGVRVFLTGGVAIGSRVRTSRTHGGSGDLRA
jgi:uncharacterized membrane protein